MLEILKFVSLAAPEQGPDLVIALCQRNKLSKNCQETHGRNGFGSVITQVLANGDVGGYDGQVRAENFRTRSCLFICIGHRHFARTFWACALLRLHFR
jgi:hypothetical protein